MGRILFSLSVILLLCFSVSAQEYDYCAGAGGAAALTYQCTDATHDGANTDITLCEDFDGAASCADGYSSTCRNLWTVTKGDAGDTVDFDNADAPSPLAGTYSLRGISTTTTPTTINKDTGANDNLYVHARMNIDTYNAPAADMLLINIYRSAGASICALLVDSATGRFEVYTNGNTLHESLSPLADTTYYIWLESVKNTSCLAYISTTTTKPETATITAGTVVNYATAGVKMTFDESNNIVFDHIRVNTSAFGSNPQ
jgi:hypothetical protein